MKKKKKLTKIVFALNGFLFLMGGVLLISDNKLIFGIIQLVASVLNIGMILKFRDDRTMKKLNYATLAMNVIVCTSIAIDNILVGKMYIQYIWFFAAFMSLVALTIQVKKTKILPNHG